MDMENGEVPDLMKPRLFELTLDLASGRAGSRKLCDVTCEFPRIDERLMGARPARLSLHYTKRLKPGLQTAERWDAFGADLCGWPDVATVQTGTCLRRHGKSSTLALLCSMSLVTTALCKQALACSNSKRTAIAAVLKSLKRTNASTAGLHCCTCAAVSRRGLDIFWLVVK